ncbi:MAG: transposase, partial [Kiritimatiellae bacterium]|nr:transposase [Kiritimatiellia bacterium]
MKTFTTPDLPFAPINGKKVFARFDDPAVSSDGGALLLREVDSQIGLCERLAKSIADGRRQSHVD